MSRHFSDARQPSQVRAPHRHSDANVFHELTEAWLYNRAKLAVMVLGKTLNIVGKLPLQVFEQRVDSQPTAIDGQRILRSTEKLILAVHSITHERLRETVLSSTGQ